MHKSIILLTTVLLAVASMGTGFAGTLPDQQAAFIDVLGTGANSGQYVVGWRFTLLSDYLVTHLGYLDWNDDGFNLGETHDVAIYSCTGGASCPNGLLVIGPTTISTADPLQNHFRWEEITPSLLTAGDYVIAGTAHTEQYVYTGGTVTFDPRVVWREGRYFEPPGGPLVFPDVTNPNPPISYFGPNFGTVPEPGSLYLLGGAALLLLGKYVKKSS